LRSLIWPNAVLGIVALERDDHEVAMGVGAERLLRTRPASESLNSWWRGLSVFSVA